ncbi:unnamed protein product [Didymodactylos carnosus]|uniref:non-specific serine/threonine protein kinase n=1 Tax=Didymodactylos carnosus TaxID=1234261 RepID=A0A814KZZ8_9BILA|nr:unnamed protein product [Didymodactylos carnosus]CAF1059152.1 unnamed protein product [Didymodactylos carnosus]CAF3493682.1 unnamed protein product [Didymodactylos carnosus]CAF3827725.1 unnamed protein product [Didymodactylos carnosus]
MTTTCLVKETQREPLYHQESSATLLIAGIWQLERKLGSGSFGEVYRAINFQTGETVAIKLELNHTHSQQLAFEAKLYKLMKGGIGIPKLLWFGEEGDYKCLVIELLGASLEDLFNTCLRKFSLKTILMLADQMIARIEYVHRKHYLHRDIKPDNFLIGSGQQCTKVYVIDFGLAKKFYDNRSRKHIPYKEGKSLTGTPRYVSISTHLGIEQSRRDDMEALAYVFIYFNCGQLPWQGIKALNKRQKYERICESKMSTPITVLCAGFPPEFAMYLSYCRRLKYTDEPDYTYLRQIFRNLYYRLNYIHDSIFDWIICKRSSDRQQQQRIQLSAAEGEGYKRILIEFQSSLHDENQHHLVTRQEQLVV